jgi:aminoglycoside 6'-N-acetyltransferase I
MRIEPCSKNSQDEWLPLRQCLWPHPDNEHRDEMKRALDNPDAMSFLARDESGAAIGFAEATLRHDYVNGCTTSPVGFLEGLYVRPDCRRHGVARALCQAVEGWVRGRGCSELASDTWLGHHES